jgi:hypothetical protein
MRTRSWAYLLCAASLLGCGAGTAGSEPADGARVVVNTVPPAKYTLSAFRIADHTNPNTPTLEWSQEEKPWMLFRTSVQILPEGSYSMAGRSFTYSLPPPIGTDPYASFNGSFCQGGCEGSVTSRIDYDQRKLIIDMDLSFDVGVPVCTTRYCVTVAADQTNIYTPCSASMECGNIFEGCACQEYLPCSGSTARTAADLCPNPEYKTDKISVLVMANTGLTQDMIESGN